MKEYIDNLTGLNNMLYLYENYYTYIEKNPNTYTVSIDFQKLKYINDNFGHAIGDLCIITFADIVKKVFDDSLLIRRSGDEFIIITSLELEVIVRNIHVILEKLENVYKEGIIPISFKFNCGIKKSEYDLKETLFKADITMYYAKNNDKIIEYYRSEFLTNIKNREQFIKNIDHLIQTKSFNYQTQSIFDIDGTTPLIKEIYTRDENNKSVFQDGKFEILQTNYRLKRMDLINIEKLLNSSIIKGQRYMISIHYQTLISHEYDFVADLKKLIIKNNVDPKMVCLNINTLEYNDTIKRLIETLIELKNIGIKIGIEGLSFLEKQYIIPIISAVDIDYVKINRQVLLKGMNERRVNIVLQYMVKLLLSLNIKPIFVNVEKDYERDFIKRIDERCLIKGYLYSEEENIDMN